MREKGMMKKTRLFWILFISLLAVWSISAFGDEIDDSVVGLYKEHGYVNEYFGYQLDLPDEFTPESRGLMTFVNESVVDSANKESNIDHLKTLLKLSAAKVFGAESDRDFITITVESPGILKDYWEEEDVVAENSVQTIVTSLQEKADEAGAFLTNVDTHVDTLDDFAGGKHSVILYKYTWDEIPVYGLFVLIRSADRQYLSEIMMESSDAASIEKICGYFSAL